MQPATTLADAIAGIERLSGDGPNHFTSYVSGGIIGWSVNAPTVDELIALLSNWFAEPTGGPHP